MQITKEEKGNLNALIKLKVGPDDYQEKVDKKCRDYGKKAQIPGFRQGKIPIGIIKKMIGKSVMAEEINKLLSDSIYNYLEQNKIEFLCHPMPLDEKHETFDFSHQNEFEFQYELGLAPEFDVAISSKDLFTRYLIKIDDSLVDRFIKNVREKYGKMDEMEVSSENDMLFGELIELNNGEQKKDGIKHSCSIRLSEIEDDIKKNFTGLKKGNKIVLEPETLTKCGTDITDVPGISMDEAKNLKSDFEFTVTNIYRRTPAEINQELFDKLLGANSVTSEEEFRTRMTERLKQTLETESNNKLRKNFMDTLLDKYKLELPDDFLRKWLIKVNKEASKEQVEKEYGRFSDGLRWELITKKIMKKHNITVSNEEVHGQIKKFVSGYMASVGYTNMDEKELEHLVHRELENEESARKYYQELCSIKINDLFTATFTIQDKEVTYEEFEENVNNKNKKSGFLSNLLRLTK